MMNNNNNVIPMDDDGEFVATTKILCCPPPFTACAFCKVHVEWKDIKKIVIRTGRGKDDERRRTRRKVLSSEMCLSPGYHQPIALNCSSAGDVVDSAKLGHTPSVCVGVSICVVIIIIIMGRTCKCKSIYCDDEFHKDPCRRRHSLLRSLHPGSDNR